MLYNPKQFQYDTDYNKQSLAHACIRKDDWPPCDDDEEKQLRDTLEYAKFSFKMDREAKRDLEEEEKKKVVEENNQMNMNE